MSFILKGPSTFISAFEKTICEKPTGKTNDTLQYELTICRNEALNTFKILNFQFEYSGSNTLVII